MPNPLRFLILTVLAVLTACSSVPSERVQDLLVRHGFGRRAEGDAQVENYASTGDMLRFDVPYELLVSPVYADLGLLVSAPQPVAIDGTIFIPGVGGTYVLGLTEKEIGALVTEQLQAFYNDKISVTCRIISSIGKYFFMFGEVTLKGIQPLRGDFTVLDALSINPWNSLANIGKIRLIRADPKNPLIVTINLRDIAYDGISTYNLQLRENDIIYVPPTFFGSISRFLQKLVEPLAVVVQALFQWAYAEQSVRYLTGQSDFFFGYPGWYF